MKQRIITGVIFGILVLFLANYSVLTASVFLAIVGILSTYEYLMIIFTKAFRTKVILYLLIEAILAYILIIDNGQSIADINLLYISVAFVVYSIISLYLPNKPFNHNQFALFHVALYIVVPFVLLYKYMQNGHIGHREILMSILVFIWISDSAAYFVGSKIGKTKLFERISPGKTWEGSLGAGVITLFIAAVTHFFIFNGHNLSYWVLIALAIWVVGTYGDLYESSIKRQYNVKDSGTLLPGHGGFLDRFDSFIFVIPIVLLIWHYLI